MNPLQKQPKRYLDFLDSLRGLAALYVVLHHSMLQFHLPANSIMRKITFPLRYGHWAVDLFIVLSGFCLMLPVIKNKGVIKEGSMGFFKRRARRILPPYYLALFFSLILIYTIIGQKTHTHWDGSIPVSQWDILSHLVLIQDVFADTSPKINHAFWSISVEWRIYFLFPVLVYLWNRWGAIPTSIFSITASLLTGYALLYTDLNMNYWGINPQYLGLFTLGMLSAYVSDKLTNPGAGKKFGWPSIAALSLVVGYFYMMGYFLEYQKVLFKSMVFDVILGMFIALFLALLSMGKLRFVHSILSWKPLVFLGTFGYSIYLLHAPLIQVFWQYVLRPLQLPANVSVCVSLLAGTSFILGCCYLFYLVAEKPFLNRKPIEVVDEKQSSGKDVRWQFRFYRNKLRAYRRRA